MPKTSGSNSIAAGGFGGGRVSVVDSLRGIACLAVCLCHITLDAKRFTGSTWLQEFGSFGMHGVDLFFVISGFVIPLSLANAGYRLQNFGAFMAKRLLRLHPPYVVTILGIMLIGYGANLVPAFKGPRFEPGVWELTLHLVYGNSLAGYPWLTSVFWTLAVEVQWYLLIGLSFPLLRRPGGVHLFGLLFVGLGLWIFPAESLVFRYAPCFMIGLATFMKVSGAWQIRLWAAYIAVMALIIYWVLGIGPTVASLIGGLGIVYGHKIGGSSMLGFFGTISYSLYLVHFPLGARLLNLGGRVVPSGPAGYLLLVLAFAATVGAAYIMWRYVEDWSQRRASAVKYM